MLVTKRLLQAKSIKMALALFLIAASVGLARAEEVRYVSDQLTLKMYKDSALNGLLPSLKSGDRVLVIRQDDSYSQVEIDDGTVGWVKSSYLEEAKPAAVRLVEVQKELDDLRSKHTDLLIEQPEIIQSPDKQLQARLESAESSQQNMKLRMQELEQQRLTDIEELQALRQAPSAGTPAPESALAIKVEHKLILIWIILPLLMLISGFFIGFKYLEGKIKQRFGGYNPL